MGVNVWKSACSGCNETLRACTACRVIGRGATRSLLTFCTLTPELRAALAQHKRQIIVALSATTRGDTGEFIDWNQLPDPATATEALGQKDMDDIKAGHAVPVWLGIVQEWAWWVRGEVERQKLLSEGCKLPIYTLGELAVIVNMSDQAVKNMHALKRDMGAVIRPAGQDGKP